MAIDLRKTYGIEAVELEWNYPDYLKAALDTAVKQREDHRKRMQGRSSKAPRGGPLPMRAGPA
jgi:hypothetical protein